MRGMDEACKALSNELLPCNQRFQADFFWNETQISNGFNFGQFAYEQTTSDSEKKGHRTFPSTGCVGVIETLLKDHPGFVVSRTKSNGSTAKKRDSVFRTTLACQHHKPYKENSASPLGIRGIPVLKLRGKDMVGRVLPTFRSAIEGGFWEDAIILDYDPDLGLYECESIPISNGRSENL